MLFPANGSRQCLVVAFAVNPLKQVICSCIVCSNTIPYLCCPNPRPTQLPLTSNTIQFTKFKEASASLDTVSTWKSVCKGILLEHYTELNQTLQQRGLSYLASTEVSKCHTTILALLQQTGTTGKLKSYFWGIVYRANGPRSSASKVAAQQLQVSDS